MLSSEGDAYKKFLVLGERLVWIFRLKLPPSPTPVVQPPIPSKTHDFRLMFNSLSGVITKLLVATSTDGNRPDCGGAPILIVASAVLAVAVKLFEVSLVHV